MSANHVRRKDGTTFAERAAASQPGDARKPQPPATKPQIGCIHAMLNKLGLMAQKATLTQSFTEGRSESLSDLTLPEATAFIQHLKRQDPEEQKAEKMRRKIISMAHEMAWRIPGTTRIDMVRLDAWMEKSSIQHKKLNRYQLAELPALVTQFEKVHESFLKGL